jgi:lipopolysaccharide/colanic/teichoic acid biosynthesis glycosyltransferase
MSWVVVAVVAAVLQLVVAEAFGWLPRIAQHLIRRAVRRLPSEHRERYAEEWLADLDELPVKGVSSVLFALHVVVRTPSMRRALTGTDARRRFRRAFEIAYASGMMLVIAPVLALIAVAITVGARSQRPLPTVYRALRVGHNGQSFASLRFRTFSVDHDGTPHPTAVGMIVRRSNLNELPLFLNVLFGDMALVGPPPLRPRDPVPVAYAALTYPKPGMVCWTSLALAGWLSIERARERDLAHNARWTVRGEILLMLAAARAVLARPR